MCGFYNIYSELGNYFLADDTRRGLLGVRVMSLIGVRLLAGQAHAVFDVVVDDVVEFFKTQFQCLCKINVNSIDIIFCLFWNKALDM